MPSVDLRQRLRRIGVIRSTTNDPPLNAATVQPAVPLPGRLINNHSGPCHLVKTRYPLSKRHGDGTLGDILNCSSLTAANLAQTNHNRNIDLRGMAFLDTETTGLSGGAGTLAFLVGVGTFSGGEFILRQFFLRDPGEELGMLTELSDLLAGCSCVTTFNGRAYDVPLLKSRFTLNRRSEPFHSLEQFDLLPPARRLWRGRTTACSLGVLEQEVLGIGRGIKDVPGWLIPRIYAHHLRTGATHDIIRVIYHNAIDILSMVTLATHLLRVYSEPLAKDRSGNDCLRVALWMDDNGQNDLAEDAYRAALDRSLPTSQQSIALRRLAAFLKRANRRIDALPLWEQLADLTRDDPDPCVEMAKYFEWYAGCMQPAVDWTERALGTVQDWSSRWRREKQIAALQHRLQRVQKKRDMMLTNQHADR